MQIDEYTHAAVLVSFYRTFTERLGKKRGEELFRLCTDFYGERRGRRMAVRAFRDGNPLDFSSYFAYGELINTPGSYTGTYEVTSPGICVETQTGCPWASAFQKLCGMDCASVYCSLIDLAIVRGFNPQLKFEYVQNMHCAGSCIFNYYGDDIEHGFMDTYKNRLKSSNTRRHMDYHSADVYNAFRTCSLPVLGEEILTETDRRIEEITGKEVLSMLKEWPEGDLSPKSV